MNSNAILAVIALAAVASPIITAIINNHYLMKMKEIDHNDEIREQTYLHKREILEDAISALGAYGCRVDDIDKCGSKLLLSCAYVDGAVSEQIFSIATKMKYRNPIEQNELSALSTALKSSITNLDSVSH